MRWLLLCAAPAALALPPVQATSKPAVQPPLSLGALSVGALSLGVPGESSIRSSAAAEQRAPKAPPDSLLTPKAPLVPTPAIVRGLYVNRWAAMGKRVWELIDVAEHTEVNALVIDVKDDRGYVLYRSRVPLAREIGADTIRPMTAAHVRAMLDTMRTHGIYPIARIVVAKDPLLAEARPEWAIRSRADTTKPWRDKQGRAWLDAHQWAVWQYAADLAHEAVDLGFSEIQFDYVRFPDDKHLMTEASFPLAKGRLRAQVIREQLGRVHALLAPLDVPVTADVFGLTATDTTDMGIGQRWEMFADQVDVVLPMSYPSHYAPGTYGFSSPNAHPFEVIDRTLKDAKRRSASLAHVATVRPWYQDFTLGPPHYGAEQVRQQMKAGYANGVESWILWNPGSRYSLDALGPYNDSRRSSSSPASPACPNRCADSMPLRSAARASSVRPSDSSAAASRP